MGLTEIAVKTWILLLSSIAIAHSAIAAKPNVLFIAVDDLNDWIEVHDTLYAVSFV